MMGTKCLAVVGVLALGLVARAEVTLLYANDFGSDAKVAEKDAGNAVSCASGTYLNLAGWSDAYWQKVLSVRKSGEISVDVVCLPNWQNPGTVLSLNETCLVACNNASVTLGTGDAAIEHAVNVGNQSVSRRMTVTVNPTTGEGTVSYVHLTDATHADNCSAVFTMPAITDGKLLVKFGIVGNTWKVDSLSVTQDISEPEEDPEIEDGAGITRQTDGSIVLDLLARNGGKTGGLLDSVYEDIATSSYDEATGIETLSRGDAWDLTASPASVDDGAIDLIFTRMVQGKWSGPALNAGALPIKLKELGTVTMPYRYAGAKLVGQKMRLIAYTQSKTFTVESTDGIVSSEADWQSAVFDFDSLFADNAAEFKAASEETLTGLRFYFYGTKVQVVDKTNFPATLCGYWDGINFDVGKPFTIGRFAFSGVPVGFTARFDSKGGASVAPVVSDEGGKMTLPACTREGYTFLGWNDRAVTYAAGAEVTLGMNTTFYAVWQATRTEAGLATDGRETKVDYIRAQGNALGMLDDVYRNIYTGTYDAAAVKFAIERSGSYRVSAGLAEYDGHSDILLMKGEVYNGGWNGPALVLPGLDLSIRKANQLTITYCYTYPYGNDALSGTQPTLYFQVGETWYRTTSATATVKDQWATWTFDLRAAMGEDYAAHKKDALGKMRFYPYPVNQDVGSSAWSDNYSFQVNAMIYMKPFVFTDDPSLHGMTIVIH